MKMNWVINFLVCIGVVIYCVEGSSVEELKEEYLGMIKECADQYKPTPDELTELRTRDIQSETMKCLIACAYKKTGMMDDNGMFSVEGANKIIEKYYSDDPEELEKGKQFTETCKSVNDASVSDGDKGCDRAVLMFKCTLENMPGGFNK